VKQNERLVFVRLESGEPSRDARVARQRSIVFGVISSIGMAPKAGSKCAEMIDR
jgi:hypothetical protein